MNKGLRQNSYLPPHVPRMGVGNRDLMNKGLRLVYLKAYVVTIEA